MSDVTQPAILLIRSGRHQGRLFTLPDEEVIVGRDETCRVRLNSSDVSRRHCSIRSTSRGIVVRDLGSRNGTQVNDQRIDGEVVLAPGDVLRIGPLVFEVPIPEGTSENEIADWLAGVEETTGPGDTTIIPNRPEDDSVNHREPDLPPPAKEKFDSVAEEAADIIRRHHEMLARREQK
jgi:pSer/pThr/pTyr-binding forkhead associated (FHA) protein